MPDIGDIVIFYNLDSWDNNHRAVDYPAIVMAEGPDEDSLILKVFQPGVAPFDATVSPWAGPRVDAAGKPMGGGSYWRDADSEPPDFGADFEAAQDQPEPEPEPQPKPEPVPDQKPSHIKPLGI